VQRIDSRGTAPAAGKVSRAAETFWVIGVPGSARHWRRLLQRSTRKVVSKRHRTHFPFSLGCVKLPSACDTGSFGV